MWKHLSNQNDPTSNQQYISTDDDLNTDKVKLFVMVILRVAEARVL
jgi:hypothetical protein